MIPDDAPDWRGDYIFEPPPRITVVRDDHDGLIMDRLSGPCEWCHEPNSSMWRWRHNGGTECWMDMDGIGPYSGWVADRGQPDEDAHR